MAARLNENSRHHLRRVPLTSVRWTWPGGTTKHTTAAVHVWDGKMPLELHVGGGGGWVDSLMFANKQEQGELTFHTPSGPNGPTSADSSSGLYCRRCHTNGCVLVCQPLLILVMWSSLQRRRGREKSANLSIRFRILNDLYPNRLANMGRNGSQRGPLRNAATNYKIYNSAALGDSGSWELGVGWWVDGGGTGCTGGILQPHCCRRDDPLYLMLISIYQGKYLEHKWWERQRDEETQRILGQFFTFQNC